jgi:hypothetical protein
LTFIYGTKGGFTKGFSYNKPPLPSSGEEKVGRNDNILQRKTTRTKIKDELEGGILHSDLRKKRMMMMMMRKKRQCLFQILAGSFIHT